MKWTNYKSIDNGKKTEITYPDGTKEIIDIEFDKYMVGNLFLGRYHNE